MNSELLAMLDYIEQERGISKEQVVKALEQAILSAYRKSARPASDLNVKVNLRTGELKAWARLKVVGEFPSEDEILLSEVQKRDPGAKIGDIVEWEVTARDFGRIAAQTARQTIAQMLRKAQKDVIQDEFKDKIGEIVTGTVHHADGLGIVVDVKKSEGIIAGRDRVPGEQFSAGDRISALLVKVDMEGSGPSLILSRTSNNFVRRLFEREVSEIHDGVVEIVGIARAPGSRSKVAVKSNDPRVDPVGACVGMRGLRVRNITNELGGERIDVIPYSSDLKTFIANAMHPAKLLDIELDSATKTVKIYVDQENSRLAFGRKAQNVRLTQRLIQWDINIIIQESEEEEFVRKKQEAAEGLAALAGISAEAAEALVEHGYLTVEGLGNASEDDLASIAELTDDDRASIARAVASVKAAPQESAPAEEAAPVEPAEEEGGQQ